MLNKGKVIFNNSPDKLIEHARGHVWLIEAGDLELEKIKEKYPVISIIPSDKGWEVQIISKNLTDYQGKPIEPTLEHAYVDYLENRSNQS